MNESKHFELTSTPFQASLYLYTEPEPKRWLIFPDRGFTIQTVDNDELGNYNHAAPKPGEQLWQKLRIDVDPWMDQVFAQKKPLQIADLYTCSCPAYLHAVIRNPEVYGNDGRLNRQVRAPMPTAKGVDDYQLAGIGRVATIAQSWATSAIERDSRSVSTRLQHCLLTSCVWKSLMTSLYSKVEQSLKRN